MPGTSGRVDPGDEVVISGIAGRFPESDNVMQLQENLFNKVDLATDDDRRWKSDHPDVPRRHGKVNGLEKFDATFFGIPYKEAHSQDPMSRMLMEHTFEAIIDAGVNPRKLRGTNTGVYIGTCYSESEKTWLYNPEMESGCGVTGCARSFIANRISQWLGCTGPSYSVDTACSSSLFAMNQAYRAMRTGDCDAALVVGCNLCLHPQLSMQFFLLGVLSRDGCCRSFDADGSGYCRSEALSVIYLQKAKDAKRIYATVVHTKTNCDGYKEEGITFPSCKLQIALLEQFYEECGVPPSSLAYVEAHGTGTKVGDPVEAEAIDKVFCSGRTTPLRIGTVKSNLGHTEPASGLCSVAKVIIAMETGYIPPNLHYKRPRKEIQSLVDGRMQVISEATPWEGGYVGINSFGFGGGNAHVLLKSHAKEKINNGLPEDNLPRLVVVSATTEEAVTSLLNNLESRPVDVEYVSLFHNIHAEEIEGHQYRGYTILPPLGVPENTVRDVQPYGGAKRPVCFVFSGIGTEWAGMGEALLAIPAFAKAIQKCQAALKPHGVNIIDILTNKDSGIFDNILNSFVGTAAVQIGLVDVLACMQIVPDFTIGHSVGELGCAYANGCLTAEQMVLTAYFQGLALVEATLTRGSMANVELAHVQLSGICPADIDIAFHDSPENTTISGPAESVKAFVSKLQANNIVAEEKVCNNIAHHSRYVATVGPRLRTYLQQVIPNPKPRRQKWLSTSVPRNKWESRSAQLSSSEYHSNNLLNPVLFEETLDLVPNRAITIEIAPHSLLHATLRRSLNENGIHIALTKCGHKNSVEVLLQAVGKLYEVGLHPQLTNLYPAIQYPVSRGTPMISPFVRWDHSFDWSVVRCKSQEKYESGERDIDINLSEDGFDWMAGHVIDGRNLVPATGYLIFVWQTVAMMQAKLYAAVSVVFENVSFHRATTIPKKGTVTLTVMIQKGTGKFEVFEGGVAVVTGSIRVVSNPAKERVSSEVLVNDNTELDLNSRDIYKELRLRGYQYGGLFRGLKGISLSGTKGRVAWDDNWVTFMDNMLQMQILSIDSRGIFVPTGIQKLVIDTNWHANQLHAMPDDNRAFTVKVYNDLHLIVAGGVEIQGLKASAIARKKPAGDPVIEDFKFITHRDGAEMTLRVVTQVASHIALENMSGTRMKTIEFINETDVSSENLTSPLIKEILGNIPLLQADINIVAPVNEFSADTLPPEIQILESKQLVNASGASLVISHGLNSIKDTEMLEQLKSNMLDGGFLLTREPLNTDTNNDSVVEGQGLEVILEKRTKTEKITLFRKVDRRYDISAVIRINNNEFTWIATLQDALKTTEAKATSNGTSKRILVVSEGDLESGLLGLVNCLRREPGGHVIQGLLIQDQQAPKFSLENPFYSQQLKLNLALNVLCPGKLWGSYRFFAMDPLELKPVYHSVLNQHTLGDLSSIRWVEGTIQPEDKNKNIIRVHYSSLNFRDIMLSTGKLAIETVARSRRKLNSVIGFEFSGRDMDGHAIMGMISNGALSNLCTIYQSLIWAVPNDWTLEDAATVPAAYGTAYFALFLSGRIKKGDKVLIHAGSGGVGQAAITLALHEGCEVFTTVGTQQKRDFIKNNFPQIDDDHIGNSRDTSFEQLVLRKTQGRGVDIVLNSLAEEKLQASVRCLAVGGRFLEIGKFDLAANSLLGLEVFSKGISFHGILLDNLLDGAEENRCELINLLAGGLETGAVKPLVRTVFPIAQTEAAFRYMAAGKHIGKVMIKIREEDDEQQTELPLAVPRYHCSEKCSYLIFGGLGGFGLELADWLVLRGATKLVLTSRKGISNGYQRTRINLWKSYGVTVVIVVGQDASTHEGCKAILQEAITLGPISAIFNLAVVLKDALFENQTETTFEESFRAKAWATKQLDVLSRELCPDLKHFVVFSSVSCGRGNVGQTNYGMSNSVMERICERRVADGLPGLAVQWGAVGDVGLVAEMQEDNKEVVIGGTLQQKISSCLQELETFLMQDSTVVSSMVVAEKRAGGAGATNIIDTVLNIMGLKDLKNVSVHTPLAELGMDSMMGVEIKQTLEREFEVFLTASDVRGLNFAKLQEMSQKLSTGGEKLDNETKIVNENLADMRLFFQIMDMDHQTDDISLPFGTRPTNGTGEVFIIPGIEGSHTVLLPLVRKLQCPTTCLQLGTNYKNLATIGDIADFLLPHLKRKSIGRKEFTIVGYSFGSLVAIEIVRRLESEGLSGRLVLIDGSPDYMQALTNLLFSGTEDEMETRFLLGIVNDMAPLMRTKIAEEFQNCTSWEEKLTVFVKNTPENARTKFTPEDQVAICSAIHSRIKAINKYDCSSSPPLKTPITLIRPTSQSIHSMPEDYGLGSLTQAKVDVYYAQGDHLTILEDDICAAAIDREMIENAAQQKSRTIASEITKPTIRSR